MAHHHVVKSALAILGVAALLLGVACDPAVPVRMSTAAPTATAPPAATAIPTPPRRVGIPAEVDAIINLVLAGDTAALGRNIALTTLPCGPQQGPGSPPACPPGQPSGTRVDVFPVATCEGELRPASSVQPTLETLTAAKPVLYGVYRAPRPYLPQVQADYVAVFSRPTPNGTLGAGVVIAAGKVAGLWFGCSARPSEIVPPGTEALLLPGG